MNKVMKNWPDQLQPSSTWSVPWLEELDAKYGLNVYEIDPYAGVFHIRENIWAIFLPCTHEMEDNWAYLIAGDEKALLIDTGYGIGNLKGLCEQLCGKPVLAAVTHCHGDHAAGNPQWDEVYAHEYCCAMLEKDMNRLDEAFKEFNSIGKEDARSYYPMEACIELKPYKLIPLKDHDIISLGNLDIELLHVGGHAPGEACFLDAKDRILFTGDGAYDNCGTDISVVLTGPNPKTVHAECLGISYYRKKIKEVTARMDEYDWIMPGHGIIERPASAMTDMVSIADRVFSDPEQHEKYFSLHGHSMYVSYINGASLAYSLEGTKENIRKYSES